MSAYSALVLAANDGLRGPTHDQARALFEELGLLDPVNRDDDFGNLAGDITALFDDAAARVENDRFFVPDSICLASKVELLGPDEEYRGAGCCVRIHGNGYFFPWDAAKLRSRVLSAPKLVRLRAALLERFGGRFRLPKKRAELYERLLDDGGGWLWFASESL